MKLHQSCPTDNHHHNTETALMLDFITLLFQINIVMNLLNSDSSDAFGEVDLDEISALVCDTLRKLRLAVRQLDNEVSDLSNLKREILKANPTIEERRASILRQLDYSAQEENLPTVNGGVSEFSNQS